MKQDLFAALRPALVALVAFTLFTGIGYPALVMGVGQAVSADRADVGQAFTHPGYLWGRPSATAYNAMASSGTNAAPGTALREAVTARVAALRAADPENRAPIPADLVTASASGLDPHVTPAGAAYQIARIARARQLSADAVRVIIAAHTHARTFGFLGEPRVEVLGVNRALDARTGPPRYGGAR